MAAAFLQEVAAVLSAVEEGAQDVTDIPVPVGSSTAVEAAVYNPLAQELGIQFRNRRRKTYWYPMVPTTALEFVMASSKGAWLKNRSFVVRNRHPLTGRFDGGVGVQRVRDRGRRSRISRPR